MIDDRDSQTPGWKYNEWEMRGVPLRMEIGPKDLEKSQVVLARRDTREKVVRADGRDSPPKVEEMLATIQQALYDRAVQFRTEHTTETDSYAEFKQIMDGRPGFVIAPWCGSAAMRSGHQGRDAGDHSQHSVYGKTGGRKEVPEVRRPGDDARLVCEIVLTPINTQPPTPTSKTIGNWRLAVGRCYCRSNISTLTTGRPLASVERCSIVIVLPSAETVRVLVEVTLPHVSFTVYFSVRLSTGW